MELDWTTAAFEDGYGAYNDGADLSDNPYSEGGDAEDAKAWEDGWHAAGMDRMVREAGGE